MAASNVEKELKTCGKAFFVEYFSVLNRIDWYDENQVEQIRKYISEDLKFKRRPDGGKYTEDGLAMRFASFFVIFSQGLQWEALKNISESRGISQEIRQSAKMYLERAGRAEHLRTQREESAINNAQNEQFAKLMQEFLHRKKEEEKARAEAERKQEEEQAREEVKRKQEEKAAICNAREKLMQEKEEQEKIIALNRGWLFFGKKAEKRRAAKRRLQEIENELEGLPTVQ